MPRRLGGNPQRRRLVLPPTPDGLWRRHSRAVATTAAASRGGGTTMLVGGGGGAGADVSAAASVAAAAAAAAAADDDDTSLHVSNLFSAMLSPPASSATAAAAQRPGPGAPSFLLPRGTAPLGVHNGSVFRFLSSPGADVSWVERACQRGAAQASATSDRGASLSSRASMPPVRLWERFLALQQRGPYVLLRDEPMRTRDALRAFMATPFKGVDACWLHFWRLFLCSVRAPVETLDVRRALPLLTNTEAVHALRLGEAPEVTLENPKALRGRALELLEPWGLNETALLLEMLMSSGNVHTVRVVGSHAAAAAAAAGGAGDSSPGNVSTSPFMGHLGALLASNANLTHLEIASTFRFDRLSGRPIGLQGLLGALDTRRGGTARLIRLDLGAGCGGKRRGKHWLRGKTKRKRKTWQTMTVGFSSFGGEPPDSASFAVSVHDEIVAGSVNGSGDDDGGGAGGAGGAGGGGGGAGTRGGSVRHDLPLQPSPKGVQAQLRTTAFSRGGGARMSQAAQMEVRESHWSSVASLLVEGVPHCATLRDVGLHGCHRLDCARVLLPAVAKMLLLTVGRLHTLRLPGAVLPTVAPPEDAETPRSPRRRRRGRRAAPSSRDKRRRRWQALSAATAGGEVDATNDERAHAAAAAAAQERNRRPSRASKTSATTVLCDAIAACAHAPNATLTRLDVSGAAVMGARAGAALAGAIASLRFVGLEHVAASPRAWETIYSVLVERSQTLNSTHLFLQRPPPPLPTPAPSTPGGAGTRRTAAHGGSSGGATAGTGGESAQARPKLVQSSRLRRNKSRKKTKSGVRKKSRGVRRKKGAGGAAAAAADRASEACHFQGGVSQFVSVASGGGELVSAGPAASSSDTAGASTLLVVECVRVRASAAGSIRSALVVLDLSHVRLGRAGGIGVASALRACTGLCRVELAGNALGSVGGNACLQAMGANPALTARLVDLGLSGNALGDSCAHALAALLSRCHHLVRLSLADNGLSNDTASLVWGQALGAGTCPRLLALDFSGNRLDSSLCVVQAYRASRRRLMTAERERDIVVMGADDGQYLCLEQLDLRRNALTESSAQVFADVLQLRYSDDPRVHPGASAGSRHPQERTPPRALIRSGLIRSPGRAGPSSLAQPPPARLLRVTPAASLLQLDLSHNPLGAGGGVHLGRGVAGSVYLRELRLVGCRLGSVGALAVARGCHRHAANTLSVLDLSENLICCDTRAVRLGGTFSLELKAVRQLAACVAERQPASLRRLVLRENELGRSGGDLLRAAVRGNPDLLDLDLGGNGQVDARTARAIERRLEENRKFSSVGGRGHLSGAAGGGGGGGGGGGVSAQRKAVEAEVAARVVPAARVLVQPQAAPEQWAQRYPPRPQRQPRVVSPPGAAAAPGNQTAWDEEDAEDELFAEILLGAARAADEAASAGAGQAARARTSPRHGAGARSTKTHTPRTPPDGRGVGRRRAQAHPPLSSPAAPRAPSTFSMRVMLPPPAAPMVPLSPAPDLGLTAPAMHSAAHIAMGREATASSWSTGPGGDEPLDKAALQRALQRMMREEGGLDALKK